MKKPDLKLFSESLKRRRKKAGFGSAESFADHIKVPYPTYRDIEAGISEGRIEVRRAIANSLRCSIGELYGDPKEIKGSDFTAAGEFLSRFSDTPPHIQKIVLMLVYKDESFLKDAPEQVVRDATKLLKALVTF